MKVTTTVTYEFDEARIKEILADHIAAHHGIDVDPKLFRVKIKPAIDTFDEYAPAAIDSISVSVEQ